MGRQNVRKCANSRELVIDEVNGLFLFSLEKAALSIRAADFMT